MVIVLLAQKAPTGALRSHCKLSGHLAARPSSFSRIKAKGDTQGPRARAIATSWRAYLEALDGLDPILINSLARMKSHLAPICKLIGHNETQCR